MKKITGYKCEFCGKIYQRTHFCANHELNCKKNPENYRACFGCVSCEQRDVVVYFDHPLGGELEKQRKVLFCKEKDIYVYPPQVERNLHGGGYELDKPNEPMPKTCDKRIDIYKYLDDIRIFTNYEN